MQSHEKNIFGACDLHIKVKREDNHNGKIGSRCEIFIKSFFFQSTLLLSAPLNCSPPPGDSLVHSVCAKTFCVVLQ